MRARIIAVLMLMFAQAALASAAPRIVQPFDFDWRFHLGDVPNASAPEFSDRDWRLLNVPHDFSREGDFSQTNASCTAFLPGGIGWYRKTFVVPADWQNKVVRVQFDGVSMRSHVWINGHEVGGWPYAYSTFELDLTPYVNFGRTNVIAVRVDRSAVDDSRWYPGSGIERHVWLVAMEKVHVAQNGIYITTPQVALDKAEVAIQTQIENESPAGADVELSTEIFSPRGKKVLVLKSAAAMVANGVTDFSQTNEIVAPSHWSPHSPLLYTAVTTVRAGGRLVDEVRTQFGIRSADFDAQRGFTLNGKPLKIKGVCLHDDAGALGCAVPDATLERRLVLLKGIGCNAIRCSHNPKAPEFYDICDRLGLLVMDEAFDEWTGAKNKWIEGWNTGTPSRHPGYSEFFAFWSDQDLREMVQRDRNHPCIILWSIGNEIDYPGDPYSYPTDQNYDTNKPSARILAETAPHLVADVHECDNSRPVTAALANIPASDATGLADALDVVGYNYQFEQYAKDLARYPNRKLFGSETGMELNYAELCETNPRVAGQFLWAGFDYLGEARRWPLHGFDGGLFDSCGFEKPRGFLRESLWSDKPMVYAAVVAAPPSESLRRGFFNMESHWNWADDPRRELPVVVYSNCKTVELFLNGHSLGKKSPAESPIRVCSWQLAFQPGKLNAVGTASDGKKVNYTLVTAGKPARLELIADRTRLAADGEDIAHVEIRVVDKKGVVVPNDNHVCSVEVDGAGQLLAVDNGNQSDTTPLSASSRALYHGRALAIIQSARYRGSIVLKVSAPGLPDAKLKLRSGGIF
jgi:beta-galactosidase/beta-glucuronidase